MADRRGLLLALALPTVIGLSPLRADAQSDETTLVLSPTSGPDDSFVTASGLSNCGSVWVTLQYARYNGEVAYAGGTHENAPRDAASAQYRYSVRFAVPLDARPGPAQVYTQPYCSGDPGDFPDSERVDFTVTKATPGVQISPQRGRGGATFVVVVSRCFGSTSQSLPVALSWPGGSRQVTAPAKGRAGFEATFRLPLSARAGLGTAALSASADCPGSVLPARDHFTVLARAPASSTSLPSPTATASATPIAASPTASPTALSPTERPSSPAATRAARAGEGRGAGRGAAYLALAVIAGTAAVIAGLRLARRRPGH